LLLPQGHFFLAFIAHCPIARHLAGDGQLAHGLKTIPPFLYDIGFFDFIVVSFMIYPLCGPTCHESG
jgi:hypothetical protein